MPDTLGVGSIWPYVDPNPHIRYDQQHRERMRLESLKLALDTVCAGDSDPTGFKTARRVAAVANFYLDFIEKGYTPPEAVKLPRQRNQRQSCV